MKTFISYAHTDKKLFQELRKHLHLLQQQGLLDLWCDNEIRLGEHISDKINQAMARSELFLLCISVNFFHSEFIQSVEMREALRRHKEGSAKVIPLILKDCIWRIDDQLKDLRALPIDGRPLENFKPHSTGLTQITKELAKVLEMPSPIKGVGSVITDANPSMLSHTSLSSNKSTKGP